MSISPKIAKKLASDIPEIRQFVDFVQLEAARLSDLRELKDVPNENLQVEVRARERAADVLRAILAPLLDKTGPEPGKINSAEFAM
ncbi:hypothetical protein [Bradyrhizobium elkanii]|uniref:hypothetical protein n=1 Tax=Bradyrhizobium elkanii TaxID=29448 RepID=UPI003D1A1699